MNTISPQIKLIILLVLLIGTVFISFLLGRYPLNSADVISALTGWLGFSSEPQNATRVVMELRFPRIIGAVLIGAALSVSGTAYQVMFRNPMVSLPSLAFPQGRHLVRQSRYCGAFPPFGFMY